MIIAKVNELKRLMFISGLSMKGLADASKVGPVTVYKICNGKPCTPRISKKLREALGVEFDDIFEIIEKNNRVTLLQ